MLSLWSRFSIAIVNIRRDLRNTLHVWRSGKASTFAAFATLTLGIGATTTIFSLVSSLLLRPLPIPDQRRVFEIFDLDRNLAPLRLDMPDALEIKRQLKSAEALAVYRAGSIRNISNRSRPALARVIEADADLFPVMGVKLFAGHPFAAAANEPGHGCETVLSWSFWKSHFGGQAMIGDPISVNEKPCRVDGVLPEGFDLPSKADMWLPAVFDLRDPFNGIEIRGWNVIARLKATADRAELNQELSVISRHLKQEHPSEDGHLRLNSLPLRETLNRRARRSVLILFAAIVGVLLISCANVANLLLARGAARASEMALRVAVGASPFALFQQALTENLLLTGVAALSGLGLTALAVRGLRALPNIDISQPETIGIDWRVAGFAVAAAALTGLAFGLLPSLRRTNIVNSLRVGGGRSTESKRQKLFRQFLVATESAIATVLIVASLFLLRSFREINGIDAGFRTDHLLTGYVSIPAARYGNDTMELAGLAHRVVMQLKEMPGIEDATFALKIPFQETSGKIPLELHDQLNAAAERSKFAINNGVTYSFRKTLAIPLMAGRDLNEWDEREDANTVLVNQRFAQTFYPGQSALGKQIRVNQFVNPKARWKTIVGVIGDVPQDGRELGVQPEVFIPFADITTFFPGFVIRSKDDPVSHLRDVETALHRVDPELPIFATRTMEQLEARSSSSRVFITELLSCFAAIALVLACGGIFAVISYAVTQRRSEIALRTACGASERNIILLILRQGAMPAIYGTILGALIAYSLNRYMAGFVFSVAATDAAEYVGSILILIVVAIASSLLPAWRAAQLDSWRTLRGE